MKCSQVEGHCCYYCGGRIRLSKKTLLSTARRVAKAVLSGYASTLSWYARITWDGDSEILVAEKGAYGGNNVVIGLADLKAALKGNGVEVEEGVICRFSLESRGCGKYLT